MIQVRRTKTKGFTQVTNEILRNKHLSLKAKGLLVQLLSHEDGWQQSIAFCQRECTDGRESVASALRELEVAGYLTRTKRQAGRGRWTWEHIVVDSPLTEKPSTEEPSTENPSIDKEALDVEALGKEPQDREPDTDFSFAEFWQAYPIHEGRAAAKRNYDKALKVTTPEILLAGAVRYAQWLAALPDPPKTKWAQGWLTDRRWEDELAIPVSHNGHQETTAERMARIDAERAKRQ